MSQPTRTKEGDGRSSHPLSQPEPEGAREGTDSRSIRPRRSTLELVAEMWREILKHDYVRPDDNFFELGGDSLLATTLSARLSACFCIELSPIFPFQNPTAQGMTD
jgi:Phosphopantetheine attachment site